MLSRQTVVLHRPGSGRDVRKDVRKRRTNRYIHDHELEVFFKSFKPGEDCYQLIFLLMLYCGLRVCEAVRVRLTDFKNKDFSVLEVLNSKAGGRYDDVFLPDFLSKKIKDYVQRNFLTFRDMYLFSNIPGHGGHSLHISKESVQMFLSRRRRELGGSFLDVTDKVEYLEGIGVKRVQLIYRIGTHSFRRYFVTEIYRKSGKDIKLTKELSRHVSIETTDRYINYLEVLESAPELVNKMQCVFDSKRPVLPKSQVLLSVYK